jgi:hypothetical protein
VTAAAEKHAAGSVLAKLMAVVRTEFRADVYVPAPNDPVFVSDQQRTRNVTGDHGHRSNAIQ